MLAAALSRGALAAAAGSGVLDDLDKSREIKIYNLQREYKKLVTEVFKLAAAKVVELKPAVERMLSVYGAVYASEGDNALYVTDTPEMMEHLRSLIPKLDIAGATAGGNLTTKVVAIRHSTGDDLVSVLKHKLSRDGQVFRVPEQNSILITDVPSKIAECESLIAQVDIPAKHVLLEIAVVEVNAEYYQRLGLSFVDWFIQRGAQGQANLNAGNSDLFKPFDDTGYVRANASVVLGGSVRLSEILDMAGKDAGAKVLAAPRIVTKNNRTAMISSQDWIQSFRPADGTQAVYGDGIAATGGIFLSVLPLIEADGHVDLRVSPRVSDLTGWTPNGQPIVATRSLDTDVRVKDGETFVLGGIRRSEKARGRVGVPLLKDIWFLGYLFSREVSSSVDREVTMFITPRILKEDESAPPASTGKIEKARRELSR